MRHDRCLRSGMSLVELIVGLALLGIATALLVTLLRTETRIAAHAADRTETLEAVRTTAMVLSSELGVLAPHSDIGGLGGDSAALRVFRGYGVVCGFAAGDPLVRLRALRQPDPLKDSVLVLTSGAEHAMVLATASAAPTACSAEPGAATFRLRFPAQPQARDVLLLFESGSYHLAGALRYRRGAGGRQPVTADVFASSSALSVAARDSAGIPAAIAVDLVPRPSTGAVPGVPLADRARVRIPLRNGSPP